MLSVVTTAVVVLMVISVPEVETQDSGYRLPTFQEFLILAPKTVRPDQIYEVHVTLNRKFYSNMMVTAVLSNNGAEYISGRVPFDEIGTKVIQLKVPITVRPGTHKLIVEGLVQNPATRAAVSSNISNVFSYESYLPIFHNESYVFFSPKYVSVFVVTDRPCYVVPASVQFRIVAVTPDLLPAPGSMTVYVRDSNGNFVRRWIQRQLNFGMYEGGFDIEYPVNVGQWAIVVDAFGYQYEHEFEVRFWWQRSFEMNITVPIFMYDSEWGIMGLLYGEHVSGEPGYGVGNITVKVMNQDGTFMDGEISKDMGYMYSTKSFAFSLDEIRQKWGDPAGKDLYFLGTLYDYYYMESLTGTGVTHVYKDGISLKVLGRKIRTFKPSVPFNIQAAVMRSDGTMYDGFYDRQLVVSVTMEGTSSTTTIPEDKQIIPDDNILNYEIIPGENDRLIRVNIEHKQSGQAVELRCYRYYSQKNRYLALTSSTTDPQTETYMTFTVRANFYVPEINYLIAAGGSILLGSKLVMNSRQKTFAVALSRQMAPASHILAYCIVDGEVIMDSMAFFVRDTRLKQPYILINYGKDFTQDTIEVLARGPPGGYVSINAVDYEFMLRGALPFITEQKVIHELLTYDERSQGPYQHTWWVNDEYWENTVFFPAADTGMDTNTTAFAAGLIIMSDANITIRQDFSQCNRSLGLGICPLTNQCYELRRTCDGVIDCLDGFDEISCYQAPEEIYKPRPNELYTLFWNSRYQDNWAPFWQSTYIKQVGQGEIKVLQDELMDPLVMSAFFMHPDQGLFIAKEYVQHDTTRKFFVTVENPDVIRRGEQVGLRLDVYNYWDQDLEVLILLHGDPSYKFIIVEDFGYVVSYNPRTFQGDVQTMLSIKGNMECTYILIPIVPTIAFGEITVRITTYSSQRIDREEIPIKVLYDGVIGRVRHTPYLVDLVNTGSLIIPDLKVNISERFVDPGARDLYYIPYSNQATLYVYGDMVSPGLYTDHLTAGNTVFVAHDSAEGYLYNFAVNLQTINYLQTLHLLKPQKLNDALEYMQAVLARQYAYMQDDGSYKMFRRSQAPCLYLTSMVLKYLHAALLSTWAETIYVPVEILNNMATWMTSQQDTEGKFIETAEFIYDRSFQPVSYGKDGVNRTLHIATTAHATISLSLASRLTGDAKQRADRARVAASNYLASKLTFITDPFQMAITAYALQVATHKDRDTAYNLMRDMAIRSEFLYWAAVPIAPNPSERINNVEFQYERQYHPNVGNAVMATSYAMLCYLAHNDVQNAVPIMKWIGSQHYRVFGWSSTQDTILALEAMTEFSYRQTNRDFYSLQLEFVCSSNASWTHTVKLNKTNFADLYSFEVDPAFGQIKTRATGTGYAFIGMDTSVNLEKPYQVEAIGPPFPSFDLALDSQRFWGRNASHMEMSVCFKWLRTDLAPVSGMAVVVIDIPTGYIVSRDTIEWMYTAGFPGMKRTQFYEQQLVTFFEYVAPNKTCFSFVADRWYPVANMSIAHLLMIREYSEYGMQKLSAYNTFTLFQYHICQVCGSFQCPYCEYYNSAPPVWKTLSMFHLVSLLLMVYLSRASFNSILT